MSAGTAPFTFSASLRAAAGDIKLAHSVFAMPFALLASFMAAWPEVGASIEWGRFASRLALIVVCMIFARTAAMLANRLIDRSIDARNPRTAGRAIPAARLPVSHAAALLVGSSFGFVTACAAFGVLDRNWWPLALSVPVLVWIGSYGFLKRFTSLCHLYLGSSLAISPLAAALAIEPDALATQPALYLIGGMVLCWVAGFDIIYALQDVAVDRAEGLHSMPSRLGTRKALCISRALHAAAAACLFACWWIDARFGGLFLAGAIIVVVLLCFEHATVARWGTTRMALAFFTINGVVSCALGALGIADIVV